MGRLRKWNETAVSNCACLGELPARYAACIIPVSEKKRQSFLKFVAVCRNSAAIVMPGRLKGVGNKFAMGALGQWETLCGELTPDPSSLTPTSGFHMKR